MGSRSSRGTSGLEQMNLGVMGVEGPSLFVFFLQYRMLTTCVEHLSCKDRLLCLIVASVGQLYKGSGRQRSVTLSYI